MVMQALPLLAAIADARSAAEGLGLGAVPVILMSARGEAFNQHKAALAAETQGLILVCGRYEGIDERVMAQIDGEWSVGDYVLSGGEVPALLIMDAIGRLLPGVVGNPESLIVESHLDGLLEYQQYTRPENVAGLKVPAELLSGDHERIARWRRKAALLSTFDRRPERLAGSLLLENADDRRMLAEALRDRGQDQEQGQESTQ